MARSPPATRAVPSCFEAVGIESEGVRADFYGLGLLGGREHVLPSSKRCMSCGTVLDHDGDAADNLRQFGLAAVTKGLPGSVPDDLRVWAPCITDARAYMAA